MGSISQPDSIIPDLYNPQSLNRFSYALNNPLKYTDPTGHWVNETNDPIEEQRQNARRYNAERVRNRIGRDIGNGGSGDRIDRYGDIDPHFPEPKKKPPYWNQFCDPSMNCEIPMPAINWPPGFDVGFFRLDYVMSGSTTWNSINGSPLTIRTDGIKIGGSQITPTSYDVEVQKWSLQTKSGDISFSYGAGLDRIDPITFYEVDIELDTDRIASNQSHRVETRVRTLPTLLAVVSIMTGEKIMEAGMPDPVVP